MVWRITVEWLDDEQSKPEPVAHGRICHLEPEEAGLPLRSFHSYWEVEPNPRSTFDHPQSIHKLVGTSIVKDYPRLEGSIWDLVATMLTHAGRGWPGGGRIGDRSARSPRYPGAARDGVLRRHNAD